MATWRICKFELNPGGLRRVRRKEGFKIKNNKLFYTTKGENVMKKMNNKGFSLVELIVVVLIMAIIAVALAPQVMKWVENSRKSTDCNNYDSVVSAVNLAIADEDVMKEVGTSTVAFTWSCGTGNAWTFTDPGSTNKLTAKLQEILGTSWLQEILMKRTSGFTDTNGNTVTAYTITLSNGTVSRTCAPSSKDVS
jgi:type IV pilus assembly protein PilA